MQVEERLKFYEDGVAPRKNATAMAEAMDRFKAGLADRAGADAMDVVAAETDKDKASEKKEKKRKSKDRESVVRRALCDRSCG